MICPHCSQNLLRKERSDRRCSKCRKPFALEPKESPLELHDVRVRALADRLSAGRGLSYTLTQFRCAASRRRLTDLDNTAVNALLVSFFAIIIGTFVLCILGWFGILKVLIGGVLALITSVVTVMALWPLMRRWTRVRMPASATEFGADVFGRWCATYGSLPPGAVDETQVPIPVVENPRFALVCPNLSVRACLAANQVPRQYDMALLEDAHAVPAGVPVLMLHDASLWGLAFARQTRELLGDRVRDIGLAPRTVMDDESAIRLRERAVKRSQVAFLDTEPLTLREVKWLADGWWSPIAAIPPARLLGVVSRAVQRHEDAVDPDRRAARDIGFLTWPTP